MELINLDELIAELKATNLPDMVMYQYWKGILNRRIIINEPITSTLIESAVIPFVDMNDDGSGKPIEIYLNTNGGDVYSGFALINEIDKAKVPVTINIGSSALSMGLLIAMAGHNNPLVKTICSPFSVGLLHSGSQYMSGTTHAVRDNFNFSEEYEKKIKEYTCSHSDISEEFYIENERVEYWMDANKMLELGIVDEIV